LAAARAGAPSGGGGLSSLITERIDRRTSMVSVKEEPSQRSLGCVAGARHSFSSAALSRSKGNTETSTAVGEAAKRPTLLPSSTRLPGCGWRGGRATAPSSSGAARDSPRGSPPLNLGISRPAPRTQAHGEQRPERGHGPGRQQQVASWSTEQGIVAAAHAYQLAPRVGARGAAAAAAEPPRQHGGWRARGASSLCG
jgi:hypothetical protein